MSAQERLPLEILQQICGYVAFEYRPSLADIALVCWRWWLASNEMRFWKIRLTIESRVKLISDLDHWSDTLQSTSSVGYVRRLEIEGELRLDGKPQAERPNPTNCLVDSDDEVEPEGGRVYKSMLESPYVTKELDLHWAPLARFLAQLHALQDLLFNSWNQFPPCLLSALHQSLPRCRLHIHSFGLKSLLKPRLGGPRKDKDEMLEIDPYERTLATFPCLYSLTIPYLSWDPDFDYSDIAAMQLSAGLAPNLKHVRMVLVRIDPSKDYIKPRQAHCDIFSIDASSTSCRGILYTLGFRNNFPVNLTWWNEYVDFSSLRELYLETEITAETLQAASTYNFLSLKTLSLSVARISSRANVSPDEIASVFLQTLPPLDTLKIRGGIYQMTFRAILSHHRSLQRLCLSDSDLTVEDFGQIALNCPELKKASFTIPRSSGDTQELNFYKALGSLLVLKDLSLGLRCSIPVDSRTRLSISNDTASNFALIQQLLKNAALDGTLARAIFQKIYQAQAGHGRPVLKRLRVRIIEAHFGSKSIPKDLERILDVISRGWAIIRNPTQRDDRDDIVAQKQSFKQSTGPLKPEFMLYKKVFRKLWPEKTSAWQTDWHSFPLATDEDLIILETRSGGL